MCIQCLANPGFLFYSGCGGSGEYTLSCYKGGGSGGGVWSCL